MIEKPNILLVGGTGRNVGKTSLVCRIIHYFRAQHEIIGLKITNHYHLGTDRPFNLVEEKNTRTGKDSSRMLAAGASHVFYIESDASNLLNAFQEFSGRIPPNQLVVCESNGLSTLINPGAYILVDKEGVPYKPSAKAVLKKVDAIVELNNNGFNQIFDHLEISKYGWVWQKKNCLR